MTRKFTPPTTFPAEYTTPSGPATILAKMPDGLGYVGFAELENGDTVPELWNNEGEHRDHEDGDLSDKTVRVERWVNVYEDYRWSGFYNVQCDANRGQTRGRIALWHIESDEDGGNPTIEVVG